MSATITYGTITSIRFTYAIMVVWYGSVSPIHPMYVIFSVVYNVRIAGIFVHPSYVYHIFHSNFARLSITCLPSVTRIWERTVAPQASWLVIRLNPPYISSIQAWCITQSNQPTCLHTCQYHINAQQLSPMYV